MVNRTLYSILLLLSSAISFLYSQSRVFPFMEKFDTAAVPKLPAGWSTSTTKSAAGDFTTSTSTPLSAPNAVVTTDAKVAQSLTSPSINFSGLIADQLSFYERRTSSHNSGLLVEAIVDDDTVSAIILSDTLKNSGSTNYLLRSIALPSFLNNKANVRFRWRVAGNGTGSTGTMRIDNVSISVRKQIDLAVTSIRTEPEIVRSGDNPDFIVSVANRAMAGSLSFTLQLFSDKNFDSLATIDEKLDELTLTRSFAVAESTTFILKEERVTPGNHRVIVKLLLPGDEDLTNNTIAKTFFVRFSSRSILINEIMYAPTVGPEWIECINTSSDSIALSQWKVGDNTTSRVTLTSQPIRITPGGFFLVTKDSSIVTLFPSINVPVVRTAFPALNNDADAVVILDPTGFAVDSVAYSSSWGGTGGKSLERIDTAGASNLSANWGSSRHSGGGTPGAVNSLSKKRYDLAIEHLALTSSFPLADQSLGIRAMIRNRGRLAQTGISIRFYLDSNRDSLPQLDEMFGESVIGALLPSDSQEVSQNVGALSQGIQTVIVTASSRHDDDSTNNSLSISFIVSVQARSIVVNEIMYAPLGDMPEWIEFYNAGPMAVDVGGWKISDSNVKSRALVSGSPMVIPPDSYFLASADSSLGSYYSIPVPVVVSVFSSLNNTTPDAVVLYDNRGTAIDSVWYKPSWEGTNGRSLERVDYRSSSVDSANWRSSLPTPGAENSVAKKDFDLEISEFGGTLVSNGLQLNAHIRNAGRNSSEVFSVAFFHDADRNGIGSSAELLYRENLQSLPPAESLAVSYEWHTAAIGKIPLICRVDYPKDQRQANNARTAWAANRFVPQSIAINEIMYDPLPANSEFIEFFNRSTDTLDLQGWKVMDTPSNSGGRTSVALGDKPLPLPPSAFLVVGADSALLRQFPDLVNPRSCNVLIMNKDLSLNNTGDDVILFDITNNTIDSVRYSPSWQNQNLDVSTSGKSLERINPSLAGNDRRNWSTSIDPSGSTPGRRNSIYTPAIPSTTKIKLSPNPFSPDNDGYEDFLAISYSLPSPTSMIRVRCFDVAGRLVRLLANNEPAAATGTVLWDGLDDRHQRVSIGMYIILFEALDAFGGVVHTMKDVAVVARRL